jgi:hypothetical protein
MNRRREVDLSYDLERQLSRSIEKMKSNLTRSRALKQEILRARRQRRQIEKIPDEVKEWFEETEEYLEE